MDVSVVNHPLAAARLTTLRDERTDNAGFRAALAECRARRPDQEELWRELDGYEVSGCPCP